MPEACRYPAVAAISFVSFLAAAAGAAVLSDREQQLAEFIDSRQSGATALLEAAVEINSGTMNFGGVKAVGELFAEALANLGLDVSRRRGSAGF